MEMSKCHVTVSRSVQNVNYPMVECQLHAGAVLDRLKQAIEDRKRRDAEQRMFTLNCESGTFLPNQGLPR